MTKTNKVIPFPKLKKSLNKLKYESDQALQNKDYETALEKLNVLLSCHVPTFHNHINKLFCLFKLNRLSEAEQFSEWLVRDRSDHRYYDYLEYYLMILFKANKYSTLISIINEEKQCGNIPQPYKDKFNKIYNICYDMNQHVATQIVERLDKVTKSDDFKQQLLLFSKWKRLLVEPPSLFITLLQRKTVHPVLKTKILEVLKKERIDDQVTVEKFEKKLTIHLNDLPEMNKHPIYLEILKSVSTIEQENPTLFQIIVELLNHFSYVHYPLYYPLEEAECVAKAFIYVSKMHLSLIRKGDIGVSEKIEYYIDQIQRSNEIYLRLMLN